jgi:predicted Zn-ribbon and HTH transcriptional regulator
MDDTPKTIVEIFASLDVNDWKEAVYSEMESILSNETWELVDRSYDCKHVGYKLVFKKKLRLMTLLISTR